MSYNKSYSEGNVRNEGGDITECKIMVDNDNITRLGVIISEAFRQKMRLGLTKVGGKNVATAAAGQGMTRIGISKPFDLRISGIRRTFHIRRALVLKELSDQVNIGTGFLQEIQGSLKFHAEVSRFNTGQIPWNWSNNCGSP